MKLRLQSSWRIITKLRGDRELFPLFSENLWHQATGTSFRSIRTRHDVYPMIVDFKIVCKVTPNDVNNHAIFDLEEVKHIKASPPGSPDIVMVAVFIEQLQLPVTDKLWRESVMIMPRKPVNQKLSETIIAIIRLPSRNPIMLECVITLNRSSVFRHLSFNSRIFHLRKINIIMWTIRNRCFIFLIFITDIRRTRCHMRRRASVVCRRDVHRLIRLLDRIKLTPWMCRSISSSACRHRILRSNCHSI